MALAIDASSPAIATQTNGATATVVTASFTPPNNSLLLIRWAANSTSLPSTPTIAGGSLTYTLQDWKSKADTPTRDGQAACWIATGAGASMTVTVTNQASSGFREAALRVLVITGHNTSTPIGAHGKSGSASASSIAQTYTAQATGGQGFISVADWDALSAMTAGSGCTLEGSGIPGGAVTYGFVRRTTADDVDTVSNTLNVTIGGTSTNLSWVYAEVLPAAGGTTFNQSVSGTVTPAGALVRSAGKVASGTVTPAGALARRPGKVFAGAVTPTGTAVRQTQKPLAGSTTPTGTLIRQPQKRLTGTVTPAGALATVKALLRSFAGAVTPAGVLTRRMDKAVTGAVTPAGTLARQPRKTLTGAVTPAGAVATVKAVLRSFAGTVTPTGAMVRRVGKVFTGTVTPAGVVAKLLARTFAGTVAAAGSLAKQSRKSFSGTVTPVAAVAVDEGAAPSIVPRPFTGTVARPDTGTVVRPFTGTVPRP